MADVITRFKLETTQYDSKLRDAAKGLQELTRVAENGGKGFTDFSQKAIEAARSLGQTASGATNLKDKVKDLVGAYNDAAKAYNKLSQEQQQSDFGKALAQSIGQLSDRIKDAKQELYGIGDAIDQVKEKSSGGLFGEGGFTGMLQVAGGNLLAQGISKLGAEMADTIKQGIELAKQGEGIRIAFERLDRPGLLENLKEATHGTVSEMELMKQAIKFENFKLPLEDLATYLAFAQQKAKDTGESVDYLVNSIVTGLGRQSKQILDNLGISASELTRRMNEGADMTKAVADIIREEMTKAGDYVETAADRAARAAADATNEMERLGREAQPFAEEWAKAWNEIKIGGMQVLTTVFGPLARSAREIRQILSGEFKFKAGVPNLAEGGKSPWAGWKPGTDNTIHVPGGYVEVTDRNTGAVIGGKHFDDLKDTNAITAWEKSLFKSTGSRSGKSKAQTEAEKQQKFLDSIANHLSAAQTKTNMLVEQEFAAGGVRRQMPSVYEMMFPEIKKQILDKKDFDLKKLLKEYVADPDASKRKQKDINEADKFASDFAKITGSVSSIASGLQALGVEIPDGLAKTIAVMQTVSGILTAILAITTAIQATSSMSATANVINAFVPFVAKGGIVPKAATGYYVPGKRFSGDTTHIMANAGELVLNKSSQGNLAAMIRNAESLVGMIDRYQNSFLSRTQYGNDGVNFSGGAMSNLNLSASISGEQLRLILKNNGLRTGRGEYVTTNFKRG